MPDLEDYLRNELGDFFNAHHLVGSEMTKLREQEENAQVNCFLRQSPNVAKTVPNSQRTDNQLNGAIWRFRKNVVTLQRCSSTGFTSAKSEL